MFNTVNNKSRRQRSIKRFVAAAAAVLCLLLSDSNSFGLQAGLDPGRELDRYEGSSLGVTFTDDQELMVVEQVWEDLCGDLAGLKKGDEIVGWNGLTPDSCSRSSLKELLDRTNPGEKVVLHVKREDESLSIPVWTDSHLTRSARRVADFVCSSPIIAERTGINKTEFAIQQIKETLISDVRSAATPRRAIAVINQRLKELKVSHLGVLPEEFYKAAFGNDKQRFSGGLDLRLDYVDGQFRCFVYDMHHDLEGQGIKRGDELVRVNQVPVLESARLSGFSSEYSIKAEQSEILRFDVRSTSGGPVRTVEVKSVDALTSSQKTKASIKIIDGDSHRLGVIHLVDFMSFQVADELSSAIKTSFENCDALIVDLRGHGGLVPVGMQCERLLSTCSLPVFALVDQYTSSAKEICAYRLREKTDNVTLVGTRTSGHVLGATVAALPSGDGLLYPGVGEGMLGGLVDGQPLEGVGVDPDWELDESLYYAGGEGLLLERATDAVLKFLRTTDDALETSSAEDQGRTSPSGG